ncbi:MAG: Gfo/Idh/MocA family oxidoreductase [Candidatus Aenigmarchaeota archaeon]|nr:Gfo/Idh/MocA family oxidoreductase [Candidatus Aenigmarchaeota archaeon]
MINVAVIGCGYWGPNYIRIFNELQESKIVCCCDLHRTNLEKIKSLYPDVKIFEDYKELAENPDVDAMVITTPMDTHYEIAKYCLEKGKHVLIEKPFVSNIEQGKELMKIANENNLVLMVGHVYMYNTGIRKLKEIIKEKLGDIYYINAERLGLGPIRKHANALWDLATHDISIVLFLLDALPEKIIAEGGSYIQNDVEDLVFVNLKFPNGIICNIHANWIAPEKIRKITIVGSKGMVTFDDVNKNEMIKFFERSIDDSISENLSEYSDYQSIISIGDVHVLKVKQSEPLKNQAEHFLECISQNKNPLTDAKDGLRVIKILETAQESLKNGGKNIMFKNDE